MGQKYADIVTGADAMAALSGGRRGARRPSSDPP